MAINPTFFNRTLIGIAILAFGLILIFSMRYSSNQRNAARDTVAADSLIAERWFLTLDGDDSLQIADFAGKHVILEFWASWSEQSKQTLKGLDSLRQSMPDEYVIIAATVKDNGEPARDFIRNSGLPVYFVDGTVHYLDLRMVGVPSAILFNKESRPTQILIGHHQITAMLQQPPHTVQ
jgi:hypothetical protein